MKKSPADITLLDIYESIEGPLEITDCPLLNEVCHFDQCLMGNVVNKMTLEFKKFLKNQTLKKYLKKNTLTPLLLKEKGSGDEVHLDEKKNNPY